MMSNNSLIWNHNYWIVQCDYQKMLFWLIWEMYELSWKYQIIEVIVTRWNQSVIFWAYKNWKTPTGTFIDIHSVLWSPLTKRRWISSGYKKNFCLRLRVVETETWKVSHEYIYCVSAMVLVSRFETEKASVSVLARFLKLKVYD